MVFGKMGGACGRYLAKGRPVYVEGSIRYNKYERDGETKYFTNIVAQRVQFLGGNGQGRGTPATDEDYDQTFGGTRVNPDDDIPF